MSFFNLFVLHIVVSVLVAIATIFLSVRLFIFKNLFDFKVEHIEELERMPKDIEELKRVRLKDLRRIKAEIEAEIQSIEAALNTEVEIAHIEFPCLSIEDASLAKQNLQDIAIEFENINEILKNMVVKRTAIQVRFRRIVQKLEEEQGYLEKIRNSSDLDKVRNDKDYISRFDSLKYELKNFYDDITGDKYFKLEKDIIDINTYYCEFETHLKNLNNKLQALSFKINESYLSKIQEDIVSIYKGLVDDYEYTIYALIEKLKHTYETYVKAAAAFHKMFSSVMDYKILLDYKNSLMGLESLLRDSYVLPIDINNFGILMSMFTIIRMKLEKSILEPSNKGIRFFKCFVQKK